jgi:hypothetical protein
MGSLRKELLKKLLLTLTRLVQKAGHTFLNKFFMIRGMALWNLPLSLVVKGLRILLAAVVVFAAFVVGRVFVARAALLAIKVEAGQHH